MVLCGFNCIRDCMVMCVTFINWCHSYASCTCMIVDVSMVHVHMHVVHVFLAPIFHTFITHYISMHLLPMHWYTCMTVWQLVPGCCMCLSGLVTCAVSVHWLFDHITLACSALYSAVFIIRICRYILSQLNITMSYDNHNLASVMLSWLYTNGASSVKESRNNISIWLW